MKKAQNMLGGTNNVMIAISNMMSYEHLRSYK